MNVSDAIVVGEITGFISERVEGPYNPAPDTDLSEGIPKPLKYPYSYYEFSIAEILVDDGLVSENSVLKLKGRASEDLSRLPRIKFPDQGEKIVFFLSVNPDKKSYSFIGPWALINIDGQRIVEYGGNLPEPASARDTAPAQFTADVVAAIETRGKKSSIDLFNFVPEDPTLK